VFSELKMKSPSPLKKKFEGFAFNQGKLQTTKVIKPKNDNSFDYDDNYK